MLPVCAAIMSYSESLDMERSTCCAYSVFNALCTAIVKFIRESIKQISICIVDTVASLGVTVLSLLSFPSLSFLHPEKQVSNIAATRRRKMLLIILFHLLLLF